MSIVTKQTRQLSFEDIQLKKKLRYEQILDRLLKGEKSAKEIAVELFELKLIPSTEQNYTAPRLTELEKMGLVKSKDKKICQYTGKKVAIYEITEDGIRSYKKGREKMSENINGVEYILMKDIKGCQDLHEIARKIKFEDDTCSMPKNTTRKQFLEEIKSEIEWYFDFVSPPVSKATLNECYNEILKIEDKEKNRESGR